MKVKIVRPKQSLLKTPYLYSVARSLLLSISHFYQNIIKSRNVVTVQYPAVKRAIAQRWRGRHRLTRDQSGEIRCNACKLCETICPTKCIHIQEKKSSERAYPEVFEINELKCIFCGLCVETCPEDAIRMDTGGVSLVSSKRQYFNYEKDDLLDFHQKIL